MSKKTKGNFIELSIDSEKFKDKKLMIASPMYGGNCTVSYCLSLVNLFSLAQQYPVTIRVESAWNEALISRARNDLVDIFLKSEYDYFMFIDSDIGFNAYDVLYMLQVMAEQDDKKIIVGTYPKKKINWNAITLANKNNLIKEKEDYEKYSGEYVVNFTNETTNNSVNFNLAEPAEITDGGTGFMMIKREVFEKFAAAYPEQTYTDHNNKEKKVAYFDCKIDPDDNVYLSEDYMFTRWTKKIGIKTWLLPWVQLSHQGTYTFNGSFLSYSSLLYNELKKKGKK